MTSLDGTTLGEPTPSGFIPVGAASSPTATLGVTARALEDMDESQLASQVCSRLIAGRKI